MILEPMEWRRLLSSSLAGGVLTITGNPGADVIDVAATPAGEITIDEHDGHSVASYSGVTRVNADLGAGNDLLNLAASVNVPTSLLGGAGNDTIRGGSGNDTVDGQAGDDRVSGNAGDDVVRGGDGNDRLFGGTGVDALLGQAGDDTLDGQSGDDYLDGGEGSDTADYSSRSNPVTATIRIVSDGTPADQDNGAGGGGYAGEADTFASIETVVGGAGADQLSIDSIDFGGSEVIHDYALDGRGGNDSISTVFGFAGGGTFTARGGDGNDSFVYDASLGSPPLNLFGEAGDDSFRNIGDDATARIDAGSGYDTETFSHQLDFDAVMGPGLEKLVVQNFSGNIFGNELNNRIEVQSHDAYVPSRVIDGGAGDDYIQRSGFDFDGEPSGPILGGEGNDTIVGDGRFDQFDGGPGNDQLIAGAGRASLNGGAGDDTLSGAYGDYAAGDGADVISVDQTGTSTARVDGGAGRDALNVNASGAGNARVQLTNSDEALGAATIGRGGRLILPSGDASVLTTSALSIAGGGTLDVAQGSVIVDYSGASPGDAIFAAISRGYAGGAWTGTGIISSNAAADPNDATAVGWGESSQVLGSAGGTFAGHAVDGTAIVFRYTLYGDANLDRVVDLSDFNALAANFGAAGKSFAQGDFNYDRILDTMDFNALARGFGRTL